MKAGRFVLLFWVLGLVLNPGPAANAQTAEDVRYFPQTGHTVEGDFLGFYQSAKDPQLVYGYPITEQFTSGDGGVVQYFQRARFERVNGEESVSLTALGQLMYEEGSQQLDINNPSACREFPTGFHVCFAFLEFFESQGGVTQFGNPISPFEFHENLIVQYFEKTRFEWRADRPDGARVVLTDLGRLYFDQMNEEPSRLRPVRPLDATISPILSIQARAFVANAVTLASGQQTVHVVVQSQTHQPVSNANGMATIRFPDGQTQEYFFTTNSLGLGSFTFEFENQMQGEPVQIAIIVTYRGLSATTATSYRIWY